MIKAYLSSVFGSGQKYLTLYAKGINFSKKY